jgi:MFS family permease
MHSGIRAKLFIMMVLEFFIWGAWLPLIFGYLPSLGFSPDQPPKALQGFFDILPSFIQVLFSEQAMILNAFPIAAIVGMFFSNQFADRNFSAERFLAFSHIVGGLAILGCGFTKSFWPFYTLMLIHCLLYVPTISITNSIAFANMKDPQKEFGIVRMGGTIGWILAAWPFVFVFVDWAKVPAMSEVGFGGWISAVFGNPLSGEAAKGLTRWTYVAAGVASLTLAVFSLTLPHTPPKKAGQGGAESLAWLEAVKLLKHPFVLILWIVTFADSFVHNCYFNWTGQFLGASQASGGVGVEARWIMPIMSIGQVAEIATMAVLGGVLAKLGWRTTMVIGILGHAARFAVYAFFPFNKELIITVQVLHGVCYAFFFATVYIFVDAYFPKDVRSSAQGLFNVMVLGLGALVANSICPFLLQKTFTHDGVVDFRGLFLVPCFVALVAAIVLAIAFHPPKDVSATAGEGGSAPH